MRNITDDTFIATLTVGQLKQLLSIDRILGHLPAIRAPAEEVIGIAEVAQLTGYSKATIYKFTHTREIPFHKPEHGGRRLYFNREEILAWMQYKATSTIEQEYNLRINHLNKQ